MTYRPIIAATAPTAAASFEFRSKDLTYNTFCKVVVRATNRIDAEARAYAFLGRGDHSLDLLSITQL